MLSLQRALNYLDIYKLAYPWWNTECGYDLAKKNIITIFLKARTPKPRSITVGVDVFWQYQQS